MQICWNCKKEVDDLARFCMHCGSALDDRLFEKSDVKKTESGKFISTWTLVFGILSIWPFIIVSSALGVMSYILSKKYKNNPYENRARLGFALSIGSLLFYIAGMIMIIVVVVTA
ncbi:zinc ribbon domain-containing protein [Mycoplasmatota bacterium]|nr:zinc ribbon domain-containing protein [Mycoplasmatota bacterium]